MRKILFALVGLILVFYPLSAYAQRGPDPKNLIDQLGRTAEAYFLSAPRPTYDVNTYVLEKGNYEISIDPSFGNSVVQVPLTFTYGLSKKFELFAGIDIFNQTYKFDGNKVSGIGDANIGAAYEFQSSKHFTHVLQTLVKIPTASANQQLGTGRADFHFGIGEGFTYKKFGYELGFDLGLLRKRDVPSVKNPNRFYTQGLLDSINNFYDYKFEPEISLSLSPIVYLSDRFLLYTGFSFTRNTRLNYNTSLAYLGLGYSPSEIMSIALGGSDGFGESGTWEVSSGLTFTFK